MSEHITICPTKSAYSGGGYGPPSNEVWGRDQHTDRHTDKQTNHSISVAMGHGYTMHNDVAKEFTILILTPESYIPKFFNVLPRLQ